MHHSFFLQHTVMDKPQTQRGPLLLTHKNSAISLARAARASPQSKFRFIPL